MTGSIDDYPADVLARLLNYPQTAVDRLLLDESTFVRLDTSAGHWNHLQSSMRLVSSTTSDNITDARGVCRLQAIDWQPKTLIRN